MRLVLESNCIIIIVFVTVHVLSETNGNQKEKMVRDRSS